MSESDLKAQSDVILLQEVKCGAKDQFWFACKKIGYEVVVNWPLRGKGGSTILIKAEFLAKECFH